LSLWALLNRRRSARPASLASRRASAIEEIADGARSERTEGGVLSALDRPLVVLLGSVAVSLVLLEGHVLPLQAMTAPGGDPGLMVWNLWSVNEAIRHGRSPFVSDAVYYPIGARLAKHTLVPGFWPITLLVDLLTGHEILYPVYAYRVCILLSFSCALGLAYLLLRRIGLPPLAALAPSVQYAFSPFDRLHVPHLNHISAAFLLPLLGLSFLSLLRRPGRLSAAVVGVTLALGVYFSELTAFVYLGIGLACVLMLACRSTRGVVVTVVRGLGPQGIAAAALCFTAVLAPFAASWVSDSGKAPKARQASNWSANLAGFVVPDPVQTPLYRGLAAKLGARVTKGIDGRETFLGFPLLLFATAALIARPRGARAVLAGVAIVFLALSLGPTLKIGGTVTTLPLPYAALMRVPPFDMGRTPVRCVLMALFCLMVLAGWGLADFAEALRRRAGRAAGAALGGAVLLWAVAEVYVPKAVGRPYLPPQRLSLLAPGPVLNVPLSVFDAYAVFLQTLHGHPIGTGFVSRRTPAQVEHVRRLDVLLESDPAAFLRHVQAMGFRNLILGPGTPPRTAAVLAQGPLRVLDLRGESIGWTTPADDGAE
jgi:hypothetical protein